jgi:7-cyano-7-deazaguanine synthase in queuosine biosynthesis
MKNTMPRFLERHFPERIPLTERKSRPRKRRVLCYKNNKRKETVFWCPDCEACMCVEDCFKTYHTKLNY